MYLVIVPSTLRKVIKIDTSLFVQIRYLRANYIESFMDEDIDMKNQFGIWNLPCPIENTDAVCKSYVVVWMIRVKYETLHMLTWTIKIWMTFVLLNSMPAVGEHLTENYYVDNAFFNSVDDWSLLRLDPDENQN